MAKATTAAKTATTASTATKVAKTPPSPEHKMRMRIGRTIGRGVWLTGFNAENPDATKLERSAAWNEARKDFTKIGLKALKRLEKTGYQVVEKPTT